jgi:hypothetical protein
MKVKASITAQITLQVEIDTEDTEIADLADASAEELEDRDYVHDALKSFYEDFDQLQSAMSEGGTVDRLTVDCVTVTKQK